MRNHVGESLDRWRRLLLATVGVVSLASPFVMGLLTTPCLRAQSENASRPEFDVASIKPSPGCRNRPRSNQAPSPGTLNLECTTLQSAIQTAYGVFADGKTVDSRILQISGGPDWINSEYYDIIAKAQGNTPFAQMNGPMLQALLEERFDLKSHRETKEIPVYLLTVARGGVKMKPSGGEGCVSVDLDHLPPPPPPGQPRPHFCGIGTVERVGPNVTMNEYGARITDFADGLLSRILDRVVIDRTGLTGTFDFHLEFTPDETTPLGDPNARLPSADDTSVSILSAVQDQLGLKLESGKGPGEFLVIDHVDRPSPN
jgi:uncharacterized protein (TIGR03435 family)